MPYINSFVVLSLTGNPQTSANPTVTAVGSADIVDNGDGFFDKSTTEMEENSLDAFGSTSTYTIGGVTYVGVSEVDTGSIFVDNTQINGYYVGLFDSSGTVHSFFFPLAGEDVSFVNPGVSTVTSTGQNDTHTPMVYADLSVAAVCFAAGTAIETVDGQVPVEKLKIGDLVKTRDQGDKPVVWIGRRRVPALGIFAPVVISKGRFGNDNDLVVSQQHRILVSDAVLDLHFAEPSMLVAARHLVDGESVYLREGGFVEYFHVLLDEHSVIYSEGVPSESLHLSDAVRGGVDQESLNELYQIFPELETADHIPPSVLAHAELRGFEARILNAS